MLILAYGTLILAYLTLIPTYRARPPALSRSLWHRRLTTVLEYENIIGTNRRMVQSVTCPGRGGRGLPPSSHSQGPRRHGCVTA